MLHSGSFFRGLAAAVALAALAPGADLRLNLLEAKTQAKLASVFTDSRSGSVTLTFEYSAAEPEVRIAVPASGWPAAWNKWRALEFIFSATSLEAFKLAFSDGKVTKGMVLEPLPGIRIRGVIPFESFVQTRTMTPLLPIGFKVWPERLFTFENVTEVVFRMRSPAAPSQLTIYEMWLRETPPEDDILDRKPLIDRFGQWIPENWEDKAHSEEQLRALWAKDIAAAPDFPYCALGGDPRRTVRATGFFRVEKLDGRWFFIDPHGHPFFSAGMDLVNITQPSFATDVTRREFLFTELPPAGPAWLTPGKVVSYYIANVMRRHGADWNAAWEKHIVARLKSWGFNTVANWSDLGVARRSGMPYAIPLSGWTTRRTFPFPYDFPDVFSAEFEQQVDAAAKRQCAPLKDDANLIGYFIGNEPHWAREFGALQSWADMLLADPEPSATQAKLKELLAAAPGREQAVKDGFLFTCARRYFEVINAAIRRHDPNHLNLGIRFAGVPKPEWMELSRMFDVFSTNIYPDTFAPDAAAMRKCAEGSGRPVLIGEFTAAAPGRGLQGLFYNVFKVRDQAERGRAYRYYVETAAADPNIIGTHWFQLVDDLPTGRPSDEERLNYGFLNVIDLPYRELVEGARATHRRLYDVRWGKAQPFAEKPRPN